MKTIGVTVGTNELAGNPSYFKKNHKKFLVLEELIEIGKSIPFDYAIYAEIKALEKKNNINVIPLDGKNLDLKICNSCDYIFCIYEATHNYMYYGGMKSFKHYINTLKKTKAKIFPSIKFQEFIIYKNRYMKYLNQKGYDIINTKYLSLLSYKNDKKRLLNSIENFIEKNNYEKILIKSEISSSSNSIEIIDDVNTKKIKNYLDNKIKKSEDKKLLLQPFLKDFNKNWEIKTYWINNKHLYSFGHKKTKAGKTKLTKQKSKGGKLDTKIVNICIKLGKSILNDISRDYENLIHCRIDFGCCVEKDKLRYFINEIEIFPTLSLDDTNKPYFHILAKEVVKQCLQ